VVTRYHLDTDFILKAIGSKGPEQAILRRVSDSDAAVEISAIAWYEFCRGPRLPDQEALARSYLEADGIVPFDEAVAERAADLFRRLGSPRKRAADVAIAATAISRGARLLSGNTRDYSGIGGLELGPEWR
jgi:predicted nucleic acid-binding protein